ncbi:MAG TPA: AAA family ATPase [Thiomonas arsenitoxydans]|uniref:AAA family ATPase n=2 Tax=Thiomonas TaxID=32012 RepID=UPI002CB42EE6|nr:AAA family ATPase [Thiomonas arsenitoxydans]HML80614.1 AAA family ATPase [Thiomonas arsenitoxydans]
MTAPNRSDPYEGNILVEPLGPILSRPEVLKRTLTLPPIPDEIAAVPLHIRPHHLMSVRDLHIPSPEGARVAETIDLMLRQGYRYRHPSRASTWAIVGNEPMRAQTPQAVPMAAVVVGHSGVGKTEAIRRAFGCYPQQIVSHQSFPKLIGPHHQVVWLSVDAPASGRLADFAANLMIAWDDVFARCVPGHAPRFETALARGRRDGARMLDEWRQVAASHFLGVLHIDEVQNFFRLPTLAQRRSRKSSTVDDHVELSLIEDQTLKAILTLTNTWQIPVILSGTNDGVAALNKRSSNLQRFVTSGSHRLDEFRLADDERYQMFLAQLGRYQYLRKRLSVDDIHELMLQLTAGVPRLIIALWVGAHRVAFERRDDALRPEDLRRAAETFLAPVAPAVAALRSGDPRLMRRYEDLMPRDNDVWNAFWAGSTART